jgi:hypothetical protein
MQSVKMLAFVRRLLFEDQPRTTNSVDYEEHRHLDTVGNLNEGNVTIHAALHVSRQLLNDENRK